MEGGLASCLSQLPRGSVLWCPGRAVVWGFPWQGAEPCSAGDISFVLDWAQALAEGAIHCVLQCCEGRAGCQPGAGAVVCIGVKVLASRGTLFHASPVLLVGEGVQPLLRCLRVHILSCGMPRWSTFAVSISCVQNHFLICGWRNWESLGAQCGA